MERIRWMGLAWLAAAGPAAAQVEVCDGELRLSEWEEAMDAVDAALIALDGDRADRILDDIVYEMRCFAAPVPPPALGRLARQVALVAFFAQDPDELRYWALLARETAGDAPWPEVLPIPARFFELIDGYPTPAVGRAAGGLAVPRGGGALLDGSLVSEPAATVDVQHLLQIADRQGRILETRWQTGALFPAAWLRDDPRPVPRPHWYVPPPPVAGEPRPEPVPVPVPEPEPEPEREPVVRFDGDETTPDCPWKVAPRNVEARGRAVKVNRHTFAVRTPEEQAAFKRVLRACGEFRAARRFVRWRAARRAPLRDGTRHKVAMVDALLTPEPARKPARAHP